MINLNIDIEKNELEKTEQLKNCIPQPNNYIKLLIFDFDGTLADTLPHIINCIIKCIDKFYLRKLSADDIEKYSGAVLGNALKALGATDEQLPEIKKYYADIFFDDITDIYLYDNALETLKELKQRGYTLAIASNRGRNTMIPLLESLGILSFFDKIVGESDVKNKKPSADMVEIILKEFECSKDETLVLGDTKFDIQMCKNAGCKSCYVCHNGKANDEVMKLEPDFIIKDFKEISNNVLNNIKSTRSML